MATDLLRQLAPTLGVELTGNQLEQFDRYLALLMEWNERLNLTAIRDAEGIQVRHFLDSLSCAAATGDLSGQSLIDIGTGAGFPGLPLKILYPDLRLTLADSVAKKTHFLQEVVAALSLSDVVILAERAEVLGQMPRHREQFDWAVARSVAELRVLVEYLLPLCRPGGRVLAQKGDAAHAEAAAAGQAITTLGGGEPTVLPVALPSSDVEPGRTHYLITIEKVKPTDPRYPRRPGMATKRPL